MSLSVRALFSLRGLLSASALLVLGVGCAEGAARPRALRPAAVSDDGVELAAMLPESADRCVVVRPGRVAARRRALVLYRSWSRPEAWSREWGVVAYAEAVSRRPRARRSYLRFARRTPELLVRLRGLPVHWLDEPCEGAACRRPVARWVDDRTLEIALHRWPRRARAVPSAACVQLASAHPEAVEVAADGTGDRARLGSSLGLSPRWGVDPRPHRVHRLLLADGEGLTARRVLTFQDEPSAVAWETMRRTTPEITPSLMPADPTASRVTRTNNRITVEDRHRFEELELRLEDERLERRAYAHSRGRAEPRPLAQIDLANLAVVRHQIQLRQAEVGRTRGDVRRRGALALAALLEAALREHPAQLSFAEQLARLELDVLERAERAVGVADAVLASGFAASPERWRGVRREAIARLGAGPLARALVRDGLVRGGPASLLAEDLVALSRAGVRYEWAEGAYTQGGQMLDAARADEASSGSLDFVGALGALVISARAGSAEVDGQAVHVAARWPGAVEARALGRSRPELLMMRAGPGRAMAVGAVPRGDAMSLRALGGALAAAVPPGPVEIVVELATPDGPRRRFALRGRRVGDDLRITRAGPRLARLRWDAVQRYLAEPLAELPTALFPPPELTIRAASDEDAAELLASAERAAPGVCRIAGPYLRCFSPGRPDRLDAALIAVAQRALGGADP